MSLENDLFIRKCPVCHEVFLSKSEYYRHDKSSCPKRQSDQPSIQDNTCVQENYDTPLEDQEEGLSTSQFQRSSQEKVQVDQPVLNQPKWATSMDCSRKFNDDESSSGNEETMLQRG